MSSVIVTSTRTQFWRDLKVTLITLLCVATWGLVAWQVTEAMADQPDTRRYAGCTFPQFDGQAVTWARADGKIYCWEMK